jgi:hypothetical protein
MSSPPTIVRLFQLLLPCRLPSLARCLLACSLPGMLSGCFNADAMLESRLKNARLTTLEEVELGEFQVTLPQLPDSSATTVVDFHAFAHVANRDVSKVTEMIEQRSPELRHNMLIAVRNLNLEELEEPSLDTLKKDIEQVANDSLAGTPLRAIGFYRFSMSSQ